MKTIKQMIKRLKDHPAVVGLIEYGGAQHRDKSIPGDYDLFAVLATPAPEVESLHFHVGGIPVDLNLRTLDEIRADIAALEKETGGLLAEIVGEAPR